MQVNLQNNQANYRRTQLNNDQVHFGVRLSDSLLKILKENEAKIIQNTDLVDKLTVIKSIGYDEITLYHYIDTDKNSRKYIQLNLVQDNIETTIKYMRDSKNSDDTNLIFDAIEQINMPFMQEEAKILTNRISAFIKEKEKIKLQIAKNKEKFDSLFA